MKCKEIVFLTLVFVALISSGAQTSYAGGDHEESLAIKGMCSQPAAVCATAEQEASQIERFSQRVLREKGHLKLELDSGTQLVLTNADVENESRKVYWFITYFSQTGYFLVQTSGWESSGYEMIHDQTGIMTPIYGIPVFSPDVKRFVATSLDLEAGYRPNRIQIYRIGTTGLEDEWRKDFTGSGPSDPSWLDPETISFFENTSPDGGQTYRKRRRILERGPAGWEMAE